MKLSPTKPSCGQPTAVAALERRECKGARVCDPQQLAAQSNGLRLTEPRSAKVSLRSLSSFAAIFFLLLLPAVVQAEDYTYTTNNGTITITGYTGRGGAVVIPDTIHGLPVTRIGDSAFDRCTNFGSVRIPGSVHSIGVGAFAGCTGLTSVAIPESATSIERAAFFYCTSLNSVMIGNGVADVRRYAFNSCTNLTHITIHSQCNPSGVTIPNPVTRIGENAFYSCTSLTSVTIGNSACLIEDWVLSSTPKIWRGDGFGRFRSSTGFHPQNDTPTNRASGAVANYVSNLGVSAFANQPSLTNAPRFAAGAFAGCNHLTGISYHGNVPKGNSSLFAFNLGVAIYYLPSSTGWFPTFPGRPAILRPPQPQSGAESDSSLPGNRFGFNIAWASGLIVVVEACTNLANASWSPVSTNTLTGGLAYFSDPEGTNHSARFYRLRSP